MQANFNQGLFKDSLRYFILFPGFLIQIQPFCTVQLGLASGQRLADGDDLLFVMQGRISLEFLLGKAASM